MAEVTIFQSSFVSGELSPKMRARVDLETYRKAVDKARNVYITPQGGAFGREGLGHIDLNDKGNKGRLVSFEFNEVEVYAIKFLPGSFKVYRKVSGTWTLQATVATSPITNLTATIIDEMNWTQSADTLILAHKDIQFIEITRTSHTVWTAANLTLTNIPTFDFGGGAEPVMSASRGWGRSVAFSDGRFWIGGLGSRPQTLLASKVGDFFNLDVGTGADDDAIDVTINDDRVNTIENLFPGRHLQVYTNGGEFTIQGSLGDPITPAKIPTQLQKQTLHGSERGPRPVSVDGATIFVEKGGHVVRQFVFNDFEQSFNASNVSINSEHFIREPVRMAVRRSVDNFPADYVYFVNSDGTLAVLNVLRDEKLLAWSLFETEGKFLDITVVGDDVLLTVDRGTGLGGTPYGLLLALTKPQRSFEVLNPDHFMDGSTRQTSQAATTEWSGLSHLNGETVRVRGDDFILDNATVSNGQITTSLAVKTLEVGLFFEPKITLLPPVVEIGGQLTVGEYTSLVSALVLLHESRRIVVKAHGVTYAPAFNKFGVGVLGQPAQKISEWVEVFLSGVGRQHDVTITQEDPLEFAVLGVKTKLEV